MAAYSHRANPISDGAWLEFSEQLIRIDIDGHVRFEYECSDESDRQPHSIRETLEYTVSRAEDGSFVSSWLHVDEPSAPLPKESEMHVFEVRPRSDKRGFDLISGALPFSTRNSLVVHMLLPPPKDASAIQSVTPSDIFNRKGPT
jgi:hypothetical protein